MFVPDAPDRAGAITGLLAGVFGVGDFIKHKTFGPGKVVEMKANKMEVGFEDGPKLLVCRNK